MNLPNEEESSLQQRLKLDELCLKFEKRLRSGDEPTIEEYLASQPEDDRRELLQQLLPVEWEFRPTGPAPLDLVAVLERFPRYEQTVRKAWRDFAAEPTISDQAKKRSDSSPSSSTSLHGRFEPGQEINSRYRIVSLLGEGGMGEVYRADDLVLGQSVALKFLPEHFADDPKRMEYFITEVRCALKVSHPNVCRVHDIAEVDDVHFISMEYIHGDNLKSLIDRLGRMSNEKGLQIARQLCMGLEAAHQQGVLHRDLKPANVMVDGQGNVRIADFGLATVANQDDEPGSLVGTPAYMAPEQLRSGHTSVRSDLYSLGAILFEVFTGNRAATHTESADLKASSSDDSSSFPPDIDPRIRDIVHRCLQESPEDRPGSAAEVLRLLPATDPIQAALEAGQTPSPDDVASAGGNGVLKPWQAVLLFVAAVVGLCGLMLLDRETPRAFAEPPLVLQVKAESILQAAGLGKIPHRFTAHGYRYDQDLIDSPADNRSPIEYWYRSSPESLIPHDPLSFGRLQSRVRTLHNPPPMQSSMVSLRLSADGECLRELMCIPDHALPDGENELLEIPRETWEQLFKFAFDELRFSDFDTAKPKWALPFPGQPHAWIKSQGEKEVVRVEAASDGVRVIYFQVIWPEGPGETSRQWTVDRGDGKYTWGWQAMAYRTMPGETANMWFFNGTLWYGVLSIAFFLAIRNIRRGTCNIRGSVILAIVALIASLIRMALEADYANDFRNLPLLLDHALNVALINAISIGVMYAALEPLMRSAVPHTMISWSRALSGSLDAMVARDMAVGLVLGIWIMCIPFYLEPVPAPGFSWIAMMGSRQAIAQIVGAVGWTLTICVLSMTFVLILHLTVRKLWIACIAMPGIWIWMAIQMSLEPMATVSILIAILTVFFILLMRFGLVACLAYEFGIYTVSRLPLTHDFDRWYASLGLLGTGIMLALIAACCVRAATEKQDSKSLVTHQAA